MERVLNGKPRRAGWPIDEQVGDGGDSPAWSRKREAYEATESSTQGEAADLDRSVPYAELHAHRVQLPRRCLLAGGTRRGGGPPRPARDRADRSRRTLLGAVRFAEAAKELQMSTVFGAELSLGGGDRTECSPTRQDHICWCSPAAPRGTGGCRDSGGRPSGRRREGQAALRLRHVDRGRRRALAHPFWLPQRPCPPGAFRGVAREAAGKARVRTLVDRFGRDRVSIEVSHHGHPLRRRTQRCPCRTGAEVRCRRHRHHRCPLRKLSRGRLAMAMGAIRARHSMDEAAGYLAPLGGSHLRSGAEMARFFAHCPEIVTAAADLGEQCAFGLALIAPQLPPFDVPDGHTEDSWLRHLVMEGARNRYGPPERSPRAYSQIEHELKIIEQLTFPGYFLVVDDITRFCKENNILPGQGIGGQFGGLLRPRGHQRRPDRQRVAVRAVPVPGARRTAGHRHRHRIRPA